MVLRRCRIFARPSGIVPLVSGGRVGWMHFSAFFLLPQSANATATSVGRLLRSFGPPVLRSFGPSHFHLSVTLLYDYAARRILDASQLHFPVAKLKKRRNPGRKI